MVRSPVREEEEMGTGSGLKKGPWTAEEDRKLVEYIEKHGSHGSWRHLPRIAGLNRCGKSCRLRWTNYLRPDIKRGKFSQDEDKLIINLHSVLGNKWSLISTKLPGRTDNEIKNYWNTHLKKKLLLMGIDPITHRRRTDLEFLANFPYKLLSAASSANNYNGCSSLLTTNPLVMDNTSTSTSTIGQNPAHDTLQLARIQIMQVLLQVLLKASSPSSNSSIPNDYSNLVLSNLLAAAGSSSSQLPPLQTFSNDSTSSSLIPIGTSANFGEETPPANYQDFPLQNSENNLSKQLLMFQYSNSDNLLESSENNISVDQKQDQIDLNETSAAKSSTMSSRSLDAFNLIDLDESDLSWKDVLEQIYW